LQIASVFFYTAFCKISSYGNWLKDNPLYYLMNYPPQGVTKNFLIKEWMASQPEFCYAIGIFIIAMELSLPFLLFNPKTRRSAIFMGFIFHVLLILTLDVPTIFFFLFPAQLLLFIHPQRQVEWINRKRSINELSPKFKIIYDGHCQFCVGSIEQLKVMDLFARCEYIDYQTVVNLQALHPTLDQNLAASQMHLITPNGKIYGGFFGFRQMCWIMPMLYPLLVFMYLPLSDWRGPKIYQWIAQNRYLLHFNKTCKNNHCFRA
jgi:predicted DCC family thiol-disulfide oxidoreductase YuxK